MRASWKSTKTDKTAVQTIKWTTYFQLSEAFCLCAIFAWKIQHIYVYVYVHFVLILILFSLVFYLVSITNDSPPIGWCNKSKRNRVDVLQQFKCNAKTYESVEPFRKEVRASTAKCSARYIWWEWWFTIYNAYM